LNPFSPRHPSAHSLPLQDKIVKDGLHFDGNSRLNCITLDQFSMMQQGQQQLEESIIFKSKTMTNESKIGGPCITGKSLGSGKILLWDVAVTCVKLQILSILTHSLM
jgi:hypothetical protein